MTEYEYFIELDISVNQGLCVFFGRLQAYLTSSIVVGRWGPKNRGTLFVLMAPVIGQLKDGEVDEW